MSVPRKLASAQVVLKPASGAAPDGRRAITSANVHELQPPPEAAALARKAFADAGFDVGELVANSFSITAPAATFDKALGKVGKNVRDVIADVVVTPPPDFGPTGY